MIAAGPDSLAQKHWLWIGRRVHFDGATVFI